MQLLFVLRRLKILCFLLDQWKIFLICFSPPRHNLSCYTFTKNTSLHKTMILFQFQSPHTMSFLKLLSNTICKSQHLCAERLVAVMSVNSSISHRNLHLHGDLLQLLNRPFFLQSSLKKLNRRKIILTRLFNKAVQRQ